MTKETELWMSERTADVQVITVLWRTNAAVVPSCTGVSEKEALVTGQKYTAGRKSNPVPESGCVERQEMVYEQSEDAEVPRSEDRDRDLGAADEATQRKALDF